MSGSFPWYYPAHWYKDIIDYEGCEGLFDCDQNIKLEKNTLYILAVEGNNTTTIATTSNIFYELDSNNRLTGPVSAISVVATTTKISKRFYVDDNGFDGVINVAAAINSNKVELKKALINYQLKQNLDKAICHGKVDFEKGCVLFNERSVNIGSLAGLIWDADRTVEDGSGVAPETGDEDEASKRDSNNIIKVTPDRICDKWLDCENTINIGGGQSVCSNIKICDKFTDSGDCDNWLTVAKENQTYDKNDSGNVKKSDISNMTGYVKVGYEGVGYGTSSVSMYPNDYYPLGTAESVGLSAGVPNGGFENIQYPDYYDEITGKPMVGTNTPAYWEATSTSFVGDISAVNGKKFVVIYNPVGADTEHICYKKDKLENCLIYAPEGRNFLKLTSGYGEYVGAVTESGHEITVATGSEYIISAYINTEKLSNGKAEIRVEECEAECEEVCVDEDCEKKEETCEITECAPVEINPLPKLDKRHPWTFKLGKFRTGADSTKIRIYLQATNSPQGDYYFDDVKIKPALQSKDNWLTSQSCRVYPRQDSLSCDYIDDSGSRAKGWYGHCLEYDRYPGDTDACLLWWSVPGGGTSRLNEWCGDGYVNGQEDCECSIKGEYDCSIAGSGTNYNNQYRCVNCLWSGGWCGDNVIQTTYEECDHNDKGGFKFETSKNECSSDLDGDGYADYLHGSLDCLDNNSGSKCKFKVTACSDNLYDDGVNTPHTKQQCISAGGVVVNQDGHEVTDINGNITSAEVGNNYKDYFCKFGTTSNPVSSCSGITGGGGGWIQHPDNWNTTASGCCYDSNCVDPRNYSCNTSDECGGDEMNNDECDPLSCSGNYTTCITWRTDAGGGDHDCHVQVITTFHNTFQKTSQESGTASIKCGKNYSTSEETISCTADATVTEIGCY